MDGGPKCGGIQLGGSQWNGQWRNSPKAEQRRQSLLNTLQGRDRQDSKESACDEAVGPQLWGGVREYENIWNFPFLVILGMCLEVIGQLRLWLFRSGSLNEPVWIQLWALLPYSGFHCCLKVTSTVFANQIQHHG